MTVFRRIPPKNGARESVIELRRQSNKIKIKNKLFLLLKFVNKHYFFSQSLNSPYLQRADPVLNNNPMPEKDISPSAPGQKIIRIGEGFTLQS